MNYDSRALRCLRPLAGLALLAALATSADAKTWIVAPSGGDFTAIQAALDAARPGDTILVKDKAGGYREKIRFPRSGTAAAGPIVLRAHPGHRPAIDGTGIAGANMVSIRDRSYVTLAGFEIRNNRGVDDGSGIRVSGAGSHIELRDNSIHDIRGVDAMGITVYGTSVTASIAELVIASNEIYDCEPAQSEALTLNGNVERFAVVDNVVRDVNNIGIDFIGGEKSVNPRFVCRDGVCRGNRVTRARANYGGGFAAGIYVDGGKDIVIEQNVVTACDLGIEIGAENAGIETTGIVVRDNVVHRNDKVGIVFGGYEATVGRVVRCSFRNNLCYGNDTLGKGFGELWIQWASDNRVSGNIFVATAQNLMLQSGAGNRNNRLDYNLWHTLGVAGKEVFVWRDKTLTGFGAYRGATGQGAHSQLADPQLRAPASADFGLRSTSPAIDAADPARRPARADAAGAPRIQDGDLDGRMRVDQGPLEFAHVRLRVGGDLVGGGKLTVAVTGTTALPSVLVVATQPAAVVFDPVGVLFFAPSAPWVLLPLGAIPATTVIPLPPALPQAARLRLQALCTGRRGGNTSNAVDKRGA